MTLLVTLTLLVVAVTAVAAFATGEELPQIGNGYAAAFVGKSQNQIFISGLFNGKGTHSVGVALPAYHVYPTNGVPVVDPTTGSNYRLDMARAAVTERFNNVSSQQQQQQGVICNLRHYFHRERRNFYVRDLQCEIEGKSNSNNNDDLTIPLTFSTGPLDTSNLKVISHGPSSSTSSGPPTLMITVYETLVPEEAGISPLTQVAVVHEKFPSAVAFGKNTLLQRTFPIAIVTSLPYDAYATRTNKSQTLIDVAVTLFTSYNTSDAAAIDSNFAQHTAAWAELWSRGIEFDSDGSETGNRTQAVVLASQYAILSSVRSDWPYSNGPGGLTLCYGSSRFWDQDLWQNSGIFLYWPEISYGSFTKYRLDRAAGARHNAQFTIGTKAGAAFPWQSALTGYNSCPWAPGATNEIHITSDIVFAWRQLNNLQGLSIGKNSGNNVTSQFLHEIYPILRQTAQFWVSRSNLGNSNYVKCSSSKVSKASKKKQHAKSKKNTTTTTTATGAVDLLQMISPDEYHCGDNSIYNNFGAKENVQFAINVTRQLHGESAVDPLWIKFVDGIVQLYDKVNDRHPEFAGYDGSTVKQADVILLGFPFSYKYETNRTQKNDLDYYAARTDPQGPAMTWSMFAVGYLGLSNDDSKTATTGQEYFLRGYINNTVPPFQRWTEVVGGGGCQNFLTGAGGFLTSVWAGLSGIRVEDGMRLRIMMSRVSLPPYARRIQHSVNFQGSVLRFDFIKSKQFPFVLVLTCRSAGPVSINVNGHGLIPGQLPMIFDPSAGDVVIAVTEK